MQENVQLPRYGDKAQCQSLASRYFAAYHRLQSYAQERWLGISTTGKVDCCDLEGVHYTPLPYVMISAILRKIKMGRQDVFLDVGCGKGRVLCCAARKRIAAAIGIELDRELAAIARRNLACLRGAQAPGEVFIGSAEDFDYCKPSVVYLYNPFNERITSVVLKRIREALDRFPKKLMIVYANPVQEHLFFNSGWLRKTDDWPPDRFPGFGYSVAFWEAV